MADILALEPKWSPPRNQVATEAETFEEFFRAQNERLFRLLCVVTGSRQEAEDVAQEAFVKVLERWERVGAMEDPAGYLYRTAINEFRGKRRRAAVALRRAVRLGPPQDVYQETESRQLAAEALASLSPRQRAAFVLTEGLRYTAKEAGRLLGVRASTVRNLRLQARAALTKLGRPMEADDE